MVCRYLEAQNVLAVRTSHLQRLGKSKKKNSFFRTDKKTPPIISKDGPHIFCCLYIPCMNPSFGFQCMNGDKDCTLDFADGVLSPDLSDISRSFPSKESYNN